jgi:hypothetical protein
LKIEEIKITPKEQFRSGRIGELDNETSTLAYYDLYKAQGDK